MRDRVVRPGDPKRIVAEGYDRIGEWYAKQAVEPGSDDRERYTALLIERLPSGAALLDLRCGAGIPTTRRLAEHFEVTGFDISARQVERARKNVPNGRFIHSDMTRLGFAPASFDAVTAFFSAIHVPRDQHPALFQNIAVWLRPRGLFVAVLAADGLEADYEKDWHGAPMFWSSFGSQTNERLVQEAGLQVISTEEVTVEEDGEPVTWFWIVASKPEPTTSLEAAS